MATDIDVAVDERHGYVTISILVDSLLGAYNKGGTLEELQDEVDKIIKEVSRLKDDDSVDDYMDDLRSEGWEFSLDFGDRNRALARKQHENKKRILKVHKKEIRAWFRKDVPEEIERIYKRWRSGGMGRKEPCITASYLREGYPLNDMPPDLRITWQDLDNREKTGILSDVLRTLYWKGEIGRSLGSGMGGRETKCYEPKG